MTCPVSPSLSRRTVMNTSSSGVAVKSKVSALAPESPPSGLLEASNASIVPDPCGCFSVTCSWRTAPMRVATGRRRNHAVSSSPSRWFGGNGTGTS